MTGTFRIYKDWLGEIFLSLLFLKSEGYGEASPRNHARETFGGDTLEGEEEQRTQLAAQAALDSDRVGREELISTLGEMLLQDHSSTHNRDLLDTMVEVLGLPFAQNQIGPSTISLLSRALLLPEELAALKVKLKKQEMTCTGCGRAFCHEEMVTYKSGMGGGSSIVCITCRPPQVRPCSNCKSWALIPGKILKLLQKPIPCQACINEKRVPQEERENNPDAQAGDAMNRLVPTVGPATIPQYEPTILRRTPAWMAERLANPAGRQNRGVNVAPPPPPDRIGRALRGAAGLAEPQAVYTPGYTGLAQPQVVDGFWGQTIPAPPLGHIEQLNQYLNRYETLVRQTPTIQVGGDENETP